jgi:hypothetical protein
MEQFHLPDVGQIIMVTYNNRIQPAVVTTQEPNNAVLVTFINPLVNNSDINYTELFGPNILYVTNANNYIPYDIQHVFNYTFFNTFEGLQHRYNEVLEQINTGHLMLNRLGRQRGGHQKRSSLSNNRRTKISKQRK